MVKAKLNIQKHIKKGNFTLTKKKKEATKKRAIKSTNKPINENKHKTKSKSNAESKLEKGKESIGCGDTGQH